MFNSLNSVKRLEKVGVSRDQAETHIQIMSELMESNLVTGEQFKDGMFLLKEEMSSLRAELKEDIASLHAEVKGNASSLRAEFKEEMSVFRGELKDIHHKIEQLESRMTIKLGAMMSLSIGILVTILKLT